MLSTWSNVKKNDPNEMSMRDIIVHTSTNVSAGPGTTSITLRGMIYFLCHNPEKMAKLIRTVDEADQEGLLSTSLRYKESSEPLKYVEAIMKETMRLHPGIGLLLERTVPVAGINICGQYLPGGIIVSVNAWVLHHDPKVFPDREAFIPETLARELSGRVGDYGEIHFHLWRWTQDMSRPSYRLCRDPEGRSRAT